MRRRSLPEREHCAYLRWLAVGSRWLSNTSSQAEAGSPGPATYVWGFKDRPTKLFVSRDLNDIGGSLRPPSPPRNSSKEVRFPMRL